MMTHETIKKGIDLMFQMYKENNADNIINANTKGIVIEFIGGEPLMNVDTISYGCEYFINQCLERDHPWLNYFRFSISSNGVLYFNEDVQVFLKKFAPFLSLGITIDGPQELHDSCRKDFNGNGSYERAIAAFKDWQKIEPDPYTKVTIAPENLTQISSIINFFIGLGCTKIMANPIHEHKWTKEEGAIYYKQLKQIADDLLIHENVESSLFSDYFGKPLLSTENSNWCGGTGAMLSFDPDGIAYPCIRYMESSLGNDQPPLIIGSVNGLCQTQEQKAILQNLKKITRRSQSTDECFNCSVASGCGWCSAWNYQENGSVDKRSMNLCWMSRARSLINSYYLNNLYIKQNSLKRMPVYLSRDLALNLISNEEYDKLLLLAST